MNAALLSSLLCKHFNVAHYSNISNIKLEIFAYHDKVQLLDMGHKFERNIFEVMPLCSLEFFNQREFTQSQHAVLLYISDIISYQDK
jgi:hypothetical protein